MNRGHHRWRFVVEWAVATGLGLGLGVLLVIGSYYLNYQTSTLPSFANLERQQGIRAMVQGLPLALSQVWVLRRWRISARGWALMTLFAFFLIGALPLVRWYNTMGIHRFFQLEAFAQLPENCNMGLAISQRGLASCREAFNAAFFSLNDRFSPNISQIIDYRDQTAYFFWFPFFHEAPHLSLLYGLIIGGCQALALRRTSIGISRWTLISGAMFCLSIGFMLQTYRPWRAAYWSTGAWWDYSYVRIGGLLRDFGAIVLAQIILGIVIGIGTGVVLSSAIQVKSKHEVNYAAHQT